MEENILSDRLGLVFPESLAEKVMESGLFDAEPRLVRKSVFLPDAFYSDGLPKNLDPDILYPCAAPIYLKQTMPAELVNLEPGYRRSAAIAAIEWLGKNLRAKISTKFFDGAEISVTSSEKNTYRIQFPTLSVKYKVGMTEVTAAVLPFPDSRENDDVWKGSSIPSYAVSIAEMLLYCWDAAYRLDYTGDIHPTQCYIVRITGNTPADVTIRTVCSDRKEWSNRMRKILAFVDRYSADALLSIGSFSEPLSWSDIRDAEAASAYHINDPEFYALVVSYMRKRNERKRLDALVKNMENQQKAIALQIGAQIDPNAGQGMLESGGKIFCCSHRKKSTRVSVNGELIHQFMPELANQVIDTKIIERGAISIEAD